MKNLNIITSLIAILLFLNQSLLANDGRYIEAMQKNIQAIYTSKSITELQNSVNTLERIASAEKTKWEPYYYAAFGYIRMANLEQDGGKKDAHLDQALAAIEKAGAIDPRESEITALEGFVHMIRVTVDPATRGPKFAGMAMQSFGQASAMNPENPRALALLAQMQYGTAKFFNSSKTEACSTLLAALEKFDTYTSENPLTPQWGKEMALGLQKECN